MADDIFKWIRNASALNDEQLKQEIDLVHQSSIKAFARALAKVIRPEVDTHTPRNGTLTEHDFADTIKLLLSIGEQTVTAIMYLANYHTSSIKSVTFVETYPPGIEFSYYGYQNALSQQAISEYRSAQLSSRIGLVQLILSMAIPWGLMGLFIPMSPQNEAYYPPERWSEFRVQMWKSKVWI